MNRTSFFRGLVIGLFVSSFLWYGIVYSTTKVLSSVQYMMQKEVVQKNALVQQQAIATAEIILAKN